MALPSSGNPISFGDINDELGENTTDTLDIQSAAGQFTGILDDGTISMDEFHGLTFQQVVEHTEQETLTHLDLLMQVQIEDLRTENWYRQQKTLQLI